MATTRQPEVVAGWTASLPRAATPQLSSLRNRDQIEVFDDDNDNGQLVWLRSSTSDDAIEQQLRSILGCRVYRSLTDGQLIPLDATVPYGFAPAGTWNRLVDWLTLTLPVTRLAGTNESRVPISLARCWRPCDSSLIQIALHVWKDYATTAPRVRLARLRFAARGDRAVVEGTPLPPLRGEYYCVDEGIAAPVGYCWQPALDARVLRQALELGVGDVAMLTHDGNLEVIRADQFVAATPSAVRLTMGEGHVDR